MKNILSYLKLGSPLTVVFRILLVLILISIFFASYESVQKDWISLMPIPNIFLLPSIIAIFATLSIVICLSVTLTDAITMMGNIYFEEVQLEYETEEGEKKELTERQIVCVSYKGERTSGLIWFLQMTVLLALASLSFYVSLNSTMAGSGYKFSNEISRTEILTISEISLKFSVKEREIFKKYDSLINSVGNKAYSLQNADIKERRKADLESERRTALRENQAEKQAEIRENDINRKELAKLQENAKEKGNVIGGILEGLVFAISIGLKVLNLKKSETKSPIISENFTKSPIISNNFTEISEDIERKRVEKLLIPRIEELQNHGAGQKLAIEFGTSASMISRIKKDYEQGKYKPKNGTPQSKNEMDMGTYMFN